MKNVYAIALLFLVSTMHLQAQVTLLAENFNGPSTPAGWSTFNFSTGGNTGGPAAAAWTLRPNLYAPVSPTLPTIPFQSNDASQFYMTNSDAQGDSALGEPLPVTNTILQMPVLNTLGFASVTLQFYHTFSSWTVA
ncbi:MAG: hypothetical protein V4676_05195, partial [Bacteroidota bacterium]